MTDSELITNAAGGDDSAFEQLVKIYEKRVYTIAFRMTGNPDDAFDISQEAFLRVYRSIGSFKGDSKFSTWLYRIVSNLCIDYSRKSKKISTVPLVVTRDEDEDEVDIPDTRFDPDKELDRRELARNIEQALSKLSNEHREILLLREIEGLSYEEISEVTALEAGTVKSRIFRARQKLREALIRNGNIPDDFPSKNSKGERL